jgi:tRNA1Val (adenine37-N6)-methyltransferase
MPGQFFKFKQFTVQQDQCAMKVGTDGTLLGAWANVAGCKKALDVGTGTGLIALMVAQRNRDACIDAIDMDKDAYMQASQNIKDSPFSKQINPYHCSLQTFAKDRSDSLYDLIISNPPYYANSLKSPEKKRNLARHNDTLSPIELLHYCSLLLTAQGRMALILPYQQTDEIIDLASRKNLYVERRTNMIPTGKSQPKRSLIEFSFQKKSFNPDTLVLEYARNQRTKAYKELTQDFYL